LRFWVALPVGTSSVAAIRRIAAAAALAPSQAVESQPIPAAPAISYADLADLALAAPVAAHVRVRDADALSARAAKLPRVVIKRPQSAIGSSTIAAMQSGLYYGYAGLVDRVLERIIAELQTKPRVIATGGLAHILAGSSKFIEVIDETLTLDGLRLVHERNNI
jgi:type III pantothenate kinase